jgi:Ca-activated chloride channel family protein
VAISETPSVDPQGPLRRERMPHALPHGLSAEAFGLRASAGALPGVSVSSSAMPMLARARVPMAASRLAPRPREQPAPNPRSAADSGWLGRIVNAARGGSRSSAGPSGEPPAASAPPAPREPSPLRGQLVRRDRARLVIEIEIDDTLSWELPDAVVMEWSDGSTSPLTIDAARTTRAARLEAGERARLVLGADAVHTSKNPSALRLTFGTRERRVQL